MEYYFRIVKEVFTSYFKGQGIAVLILCALYATALSIIGIKFGIGIGIIVGLLSVIPYLGFTIGIIVSAIIAAVQFQSFLYVFYVILAFAVIQLLESFLITPKIMGKSIGINPLAAMVLLILGGMVFGPVGALLMIPITGVILKIYKDKIKTTEENILE